jgi:23S rRNA U2552 (ribose-2'-O)-methylase RlmE/FtsJ
VEGIDIMQISGHKNVAFIINNYSTLSEERHKKISNILSNTETNRNALVPVQFSVNLPRKTSTNSTASSTSDVSCRSNPNVSSFRQSRENRKINHLFQQIELMHRNVFTNAVKQYSYEDLCTNSHSVC